VTGPTWEGRREAWTAQPERPLKYRWRDRVRDRRAGRADGRGGIPDAERGSLNTPYLSSLRNRCGELLAHEMSRHRAAVREIRQQLVDAEDRRDRLSLQLQQLNQQLKEASLPLSEEQLNRRGPAERDPQKWPDDLVRDRQERRHRVTRGLLEHWQRSVAGDLEHAAKVADELRLTIDDELLVLRSRGWRIVHFHRRREATYLRALGRAHPEGPAVVALLDPDDPQLPDWLDPASGGAKE
jgi:hypothetical protein